MTIGTEHEYSINDESFNPLPISDQIIKELAGELRNEIPFGPVHLSKELQKHVLEITPSVPAHDLVSLEASLYSGLQGFYARTEGKYRLLGLGMHPALRLEEAQVWEHEDSEIYEIYDRLFDIRQHGWLNIQALQVNLPFRDGEDMVRMYNRLRALIPYLVAVSASSPLVEGKETRAMDNRLIFYRENQRRLPSITHGIIPEKLRSPEHQRQIQEEMYATLREHGGERLCHEWVDSRGVIVRFSRCCLELKAIDEQECLRADVALVAFILALLRCDDLGLEEDEEALKEMTEKAILGGVSQFRPELRKLHAVASRRASADERRYLPLIKTKVEYGSLAEVMLQERHEGKGLLVMLQEMEGALRTNVPHQCGACKRSDPFGI
ncbi:MAG: glutamate-cysteine ligase family protein [Methanomassiliicoccales archaeon]|nr:glutamate-cysteine ligase family protein [Methanomassiliicoccales archaeon]